MNPPSQNLSDSILKAVAYFDLFNYPLTKEQIFNYLPQNSVSLSDVKNEIETLVNDKKLLRESSLVFLPGKQENIVQNRMENEVRAKKMLNIARMIARVIKILPFVRGVFITGSLSKNVADSSSDIDFMIIAAPDRVWICRTILTSFRKIFLLGRSKYFCTNFYLSENHYTHQEKNIYTAVEVATTKVIWNQSAYSAYQQQNGWIKEYLPNIDIVSDEELLLSPSRSIIQRFTEMILNILPLHDINIRLMEFHRTHWQKIFRSVTTDQLKSMFMISPDVSSGWPENCQEAILKEYQKKLTSLGIRESK